MFAVVFLWLYKDVVVGVSELTYKNPFMSFNDEVTTWVVGAFTFLYTFFVGKGKEVADRGFKHDGNSADNNTGMVFLGTVNSFVDVKEDGRVVGKVSKTGVGGIDGVDRAVVLNDLRTGYADLSELDGIVGHIYSRVLVNNFLETKGNKVVVGV